MAELFDSLNPYNNLEVIRADSPEDLVLLIKEIKRPIKILAFTSEKGRHFAYVMGDVSFDRGKATLKKTTTKKRSK